VTLEQPLHLRFRNVDGPLAAYCEAGPWAREMQQFMEEEYERNQEPSDSLTARLTLTRYRCPVCRRAQSEIRFESLVFYGDHDFHRLQPQGEGQLITMVDCGHQFRREVSP
jgi:hypothetical protein